MPDLRPRAKTAGPRSLTPAPQLSAEAEAKVSQCSAHGGNSASEVKFMNQEMQQSNGKVIEKHGDKVSHGTHLSSGSSPRVQPPEVGEAKAPPEPQICGVSMRWVSLMLLTAQTTGQVFVIKWAKSGATSGRPYLASTVVLLTEVLKTIVSFYLLSSEEGGMQNAVNTIVSHFMQSPSDSLKVCIPSLLYTLQNNLMFYSLYALSAAVQQVTYQLKILTTAIFSVIVLGKVLEPSKWLALFLLLAGVIMVMMPRRSLHTTTTEPSVLDSSYNSFLEILISGTGLSTSTLLGLAAVLAACITSGFAGVYLEKLLKQTKSSIWLRNVQLGFFGSAMALVVALSQDFEAIAQHGLLQGYSWRVGCVVLTNALGGLLCAAVLKYADNILRCFSTALSIISTCLFSAMLNEYEPDGLFVLGTMTAITSTFIYSLGLPKSLAASMSSSARTAVKSG